MKCEIDLNGVGKDNALNRTNFNLSNLNRKKLLAVSIQRQRAVECVSFAYVTYSKCGERACVKKKQKHQKKNTKK